MLTGDHSFCSMARLNSSVALVRSGLDFDSKLSAAVL